MLTFQSNSYRERLTLQRIVRQINAIFPITSYYYQLCCTWTCFKWAAKCLLFYHLLFTLHLDGRSLPKRLEQSLHISNSIPYAGMCICIPYCVLQGSGGYHFTKGLTQNLNLRTYLKLECYIKKTHLYPIER